MVGMIAAIAACTSPSPDAAGDDNAPPADSTPSSTQAPAQLTTEAGLTVELTLPGHHVAVVVDEGGRCDPGPCRRVLELGADGGWAFSDADGTEAAGSYDPAALMQLAADADEAALVLGPFLGECPTLRNGSERSYLVFHPEIPGTIAVDVGSCREQLDATAPLLETLDLLFVEADRQANQ